jgi:hypothetical protein
VSDGGTPSAGRPGPATRRTRKWTLALGGMAVVFVALAGYDLIAGGALRGGPSTSSASSRSPSPKVTGRPAPAVRATAPAGLRLAPPSPPAPSPAASPAHALTVVSAAAFGPSGTSDGDNPGLASRVVDGGGAWYSSWYTTPEFGELQSGTGILLDMGQPVTVNSVELVLGSFAGADVEVRVGNTAVLDDMSTAASVSDVGGTVHLPLPSPANGRYVLIWFTRLPPNSQGKYQVSVYDATVDGHP